jgi:lauroyl/myristoyl acyltransferase
VNNDILAVSLKHLEAKGCFGFICDQYAPKAKVFAPLLGQQAAMNPLPFYLQRRSKTAVYFSALLPSGRFRIWRLLPPNPKPGASTQMAQRYHRLLGILIRNYPTYWYGFCHGRFKNLHAYRSPRVVSRETRPAMASVSRETSH